MTYYSFLTEDYVGGNNLFRDSWEALKAGFEIPKDSLNQKIDNIAKSHPKLVKTGKIGVSAASASYSYYLATINALMAKKTSKIIKRIERCQSRESAINILVKIRKAPISDSFVDTKQIADVVSSDYELSSKIIGPAIQIINNKNDSEWKEHLLTYLRRQRKLMLVKAAIIHPITGTVAGTAVYKLLKHKN